MDRDERTEMPRKNSDLMREQRDYYRLCDEADALGIPVSLDDPRTPPTIAALREAVEAARA
jgi:hypothetical protein